MRYNKFFIENYRAIVKKIEINLSHGIVPLVGVNECGKTTILQGIFCFDHNNDNLNGGRHLKNILNLYDTVDRGNCVISAEINVEVETIILEINILIRNLDEKLKVLESELQHKIEKADDLEDEIQQLKSDLTKQKDSYEKLKNLKQYIEDKNKTINIVIKRVISLKSNETIDSLYEISEFKEYLNKSCNQKLCESLIDSAPYILYNDDFNDKPIANIVINSDQESDWEKIYIKVFDSIDENKKDSYVLSDVFDLPENRKNTILSLTSTYLSKILTNAWRELTLKSEEINVKFTMEKKDKKVSTKEGNVVIVEEKILKIKINEKNIQGYSCEFDLTDRSKGFIWYYNFIMKIRFNPKQNSESENTVFLLDEPGSYLHETAQKELCADLKKIATKKNSVIYCTHSPQLLSPSVISPNKIKIVSKNNGEIIAQNITDYKCENKKVAALQPVYEALGIPLYNSFHKNENIVCVEGIYDKYAIEFFCSLGNDILVFPSVNTDTIIDNLAYFITYKIPYIALWDNDVAGIKDKNKAEKFYGTTESRKFCLLPKSNSKMENLIVKADYDLFFEKLNFEKKEKYTKMDYQIIMNALTFDIKTKQKGEILNDLGSETKKNFKNLEDMIKSHFDIKK